MWRDRDEQEVLNNYIEIYTEATRRNSVQRERKAYRVMASQVSLMTGIGLIGVIIGISIFLGSPK
ncbi:MAG: hypothetical protein WBL44_11615 [Nitrososphaeraceae archaeon]